MFIPPTAGRLRDLIRFERRRTSDDGYGNQTERWTSYLSGVRAQIIPARGGEQTRADRLVGARNFDIHLRNRAELADLSTGHRAVNERSGEVYDIKWADSLDEKRLWLTLVCTSEESDGR